MDSMKTESNEEKTLSDTNLLYSLASQVEEILRETREQGKQLGHLDLMVHEVHQFIQENRPHIARAVGFLDPGKSMRGYLKNRRNTNG